MNLGPVHVLIWLNKLDLFATRTPFSILNCENIMVSASMNAKRNFDDNATMARFCDALSMKTDSGVVACDLVYATVAMPRR